MNDVTEIYVHFKVPEHYISFREFALTAECFDQTIKSLNKSVFEDSLSYELMIIPPEDGTFLHKMGVVAKFTSVALIGSFADGFVNGVTGVSFNDYGNKAGELIVDIINGAYQTPNEKLCGYGSDNFNIDGVIKAKSDFYTMCDGNPKIDAIGFDSSKKFPINRKNFKDHISPDITRRLPSEFALHELIIVSSVNIDKRVVWTLKDKHTGKIISAYMEDEYFKKGLLSGRYPLKKAGSDDEITAYIEYKMEEENGIKKCLEKCLNTIYKFNEINIQDIPDGLVIAEPSIKEFSKQTSLFDII